MYSLLGRIGKQAGGLSCAGRLPYLSPCSPVIHDMRALTPLKWQHINPYGTFLLDMRQRLRLELAA
jgi:hypothetical protein